MLVNYSNETVKKGSKSIFLAGPTPRDEKTISWRVEAIKLLQELNFDGIVYVPEQDFYDCNYDYDNQIEWETLALQSASIIIFWIPRHLPNMPAFTTNIEFGEWYKKGKTFYGRPNSSEKNRYLDIKYFKETRKLPYSNLKVMLSDCVSVLNNNVTIASYELNIISMIIAKFPEINTLVGDVLFTPENFDIKNTTSTFGKLLFPNTDDAKLKEFNRTILSILLYYYLKENKYNEFTYCQDGKVKLTVESFDKLRSYVFSIINTNERENLLIYYLVINDIGKSQFMINKLRKLGYSSIDHDLILKQLIHQKLLPSFELLQLDEKEVLTNIMDYGINMGQFIQGECVSYSLDSLSNLTDLETGIMMIESIFDIGGALGHINQRGSQTLNQYTVENFISAVEVINKCKVDKTIDKAFNEFLDTRFKIFENYTLEMERACKRLCLMLRLNEFSDICTVMKALSISPDYLIEELNITGYGSKKAILLYYLPALLCNTLNFLKRNGYGTESLMKCLDICLPFLKNVFHATRNDITSEGNGIITVMLREAAVIAAQDPLKLKTFDISLLPRE